MHSATRRKSLASAVPCQGGNVPAAPRLSGRSLSCYTAGLHWECRGRGLCPERGREAPVGNLLGHRDTSPVVPRSIEGHFCSCGGGRPEAAVPVDGGGSSGLPPPQRGVLPSAAQHFQAGFPLHAVPQPPAGGQPESTVPCTMVALPVARAGRMAAELGAEHPVAFWHPFPDSALSPGGAPDSGKRGAEQSEQLHPIHGAWGSVPQLRVHPYPVAPYPFHGDFSPSGEQMVQLWVPGSTGNGGLWTGEPQAP